MTDGYRTIGKELGLTLDVIQRELPPIVAEVYNLSSPKEVREMRRTKNTFRKAMPQDTIVRIVQLGNQGMVVQDIAWELGISQSTVRRYLKKYKGGSYAETPPQPTIQA